MHHPTRRYTAHRLLVGSLLAAALAAIAACGGGSGGGDLDVQSVLSSNVPSTPATAASSSTEAFAADAPASSVAEVDLPASTVGSQAADAAPAAASAAQDSSLSPGERTGITTAPTETSGLASETWPVAPGSTLGTIAAAPIPPVVQHIHTSAAPAIGAAATALSPSVVSDVPAATEPAIAPASGPALQWTPSDGYKLRPASSSMSATQAAGSRPTVTTALTAISAQRQSLLMNMAPSIRDSGTSQKIQIYDIAARTALVGCGHASWREYIANAGDMKVTAPEDGPIEMFSLPPLVRYLHQFGNCMTGEEKGRLLDALTSKRQRLLDHGTLNHAVMRASSWYLLAQYFPDARWTDWGGKQHTSAQLMARLKPLLAARAWRFFESGHHEMLSPTYAMVNLFPLLNLIDFAHDPAVRQRAEKEATLEVTILKAHSFHGVLLAPLTRKNYEQRNAVEASPSYTPSVAQHVLWYYFGEPNLSGYEFQNSREPHYFSMLSLSNWRPPAILNDVSAGTFGKYAIKYTTPAFAVWDQAATPEIYGDSFISDDFAVGTGNLFFAPDGYSGHIQTFAILLKSAKTNNQIECFQPYWNSNQGEDAWGQDRSSPFQQMHRYDDSSVVMLFDIPKTDPWKLPGNAYFSNRDKRQDQLLQLAQCRIPKNFDETIQQDNWLFVREGNSFVAIATLKGKNEYNDAASALRGKFTVMKVREARTALYFRVDSARPDLTFAQFQSAVKKAVPTYDETTSTATFRDRNGSNTTVKFNLAKSGTRWSALPVVSVGGSRKSYDNGIVIDSPVVSLKGGRLEIRSRTASLQLTAPKIDDEK